MIIPVLLAALPVIASAPVAAAQDWPHPTLNGAAPLVIAHRGASGERPEHTESAYRVAVEQGADVIEPDLMVSSDGVLIVRHDPHLSSSTDIAAREDFAGRRTERMGVTDWWVADLAAAELTTLGARQTREGRPTDHDGEDPVMTFDRFLDLHAELRADCGCDLQIAPEVKLPAEHAALGLDPLPLLIEALEARGLNAADAPVVVQSFDPEFLRRLNERSEVPLAMLFYAEGEPGSDAGGLAIAEIAEFADVIGAHKSALLNPDGSSTGYLEAAHAAGLAVHVWTVRDDEPPLTGETVQDELAALYALGVDGVFADFPATAVTARAAAAR